ncbi:MAG: arsenate reductase ArsC [Verrucomicrobiota bacterium]
MKSKVLFICVHNSARSQMAEAFLNHRCPEGFAAESAGLEPGTLNPLVVRAMAEVGIDISGKGTQSAFELYKAGRLFSHVISVCDQASGERCPIFPGFARRHHWGFEDPSLLTGSEEEKLAGIRVIRDSISARIEEWCEAQCVASS